MDSSKSSLGSERNYAAQFGGGTTGSQSTLTPLFRVFRTIPPERVGLHGEYDHSGLAKRVALALQQSFEQDEIANLRISQRGTVVVITGKKPMQRSLLNRIVNVALSVDGAADVEINGASAVKPLRVCRNESEHLGHPSYAC